MPLRTCVACRQVRTKREMVRVVRTPTGVKVDPTGKMAGRGAYLCRDRACWEQGVRSHQLGQALKTTLTSEEVEALRAFAATLPAGPPEQAGSAPVPIHSSREESLNAGREAAAPDP